MRNAAAGAVGLGMGFAGLIGVATASAGPMDFQCAPCVGDINNDGKDDPDWNEVTSFGPWVPFFDATNGNLVIRSAHGTRASMASMAARGTRPSRWQSRYF